MSFSGDAKREMIRLKPEKSCCMLSEMSAIIQGCGTLTFRGRGRFEILFRTENTSLAKRIFLLLKLRFNIIPALEYAYAPRFGGRRVCTLTVSEADSRRLLTALRMLKNGAGTDFIHSLPRSIFTKKCCRNAYLRGAFLSSGSMTAPEKGYQLRIAVSGPDKARILSSILRKAGVSARIKEKGSGYMIIVQRGDDEAALLALMGAHSAMMKLENARITRESRGRANRASNCDQGNLKKQLAYASGQTERIEKYFSRFPDGGKMPKKLLETARLRLQYPEASLEELAAAHAKPLSRSGVYHRLKEIKKWTAENNAAEEEMGETEGP